VLIKKPELWPNDWILHHDNAPAHKALSVKQFLAQKSITEMEHSFCSPGLIPKDLWMFIKIKPAVKNEDFRIVKTSKKIVTTALKAIPQQDFQKYFQ